MRQRPRQKPSRRARYRSFRIPARPRRLQGRCEWWTRQAATQDQGRQAVYPESARDAGLGGQVKLRATIAVDGTVRDVQVVKSISPEIDNAAMEAVRQWLFDGTLLNCQPVEVTMNVSLDFATSQP